MQNWSSISGSVIGTSHSSRGEEKQDSVSVTHDNQGNVSFCLSDGAGSSKYSELSSSITSSFIANALSELPSRILQHGTGSWINDYIIQCVLDLRSELYKNFNTYDLTDYHCTLVSGVIFENTCIVAHIGDGAVISGVIDENQHSFNKELSFSEPENGEYKNETYFLTEPFWLKHLRIKVIPNVSWIIAGTDGGIDLLSVGDRLNDSLVSDFLKSLLSFKADDRKEQLVGAMSSKAANDRTNDDKSLVVITSEDISNNSNFIWDNSGESLTKFYPKPQRKSTESNLGLQPAPIRTSSPVSSPIHDVKKYGALNIIYKYFYKRTFLTISLILPLIVFLFVAVSLYFSSPDEEKITIGPQQDYELIPAEKGIEQVDPIVETVQETETKKSLEKISENLGGVASDELKNDDHIDQIENGANVTFNEELKPDIIESPSDTETGEAIDEEEINSSENTEQVSDTDDMLTGKDTGDFKVDNDTNHKLPKEDEVDAELGSQTADDIEETQNEITNTNKISDHEQQNLNQ